MENKEKESAARWIGENVEKLPSPSFVISLPQFKINCDRMRARASSLGLALRPHVKTHKTIEGAKLQTDGLPERQIVVSTLEVSASRILHALSYNGWAGSSLLCQKWVFEHTVRSCSGALKSCCGRSDQTIHQVFPYTAR